MQEILPKCLITGATGFLGRELVAAAAGSYKVYASAGKSSLNDPAVLFGRCDLTSYSDMQSMIDRVKPQLVFHLAAISQPNLCAENPQESYKLNFEAAVNLAGICADRNIKFIFTSTDLVFDGLNAPYDENSPLNPVSHYAEHKIMAEEGIMDKSENVLIGRLPLLFGRTTVMNMMKTLDAGEKLYLFEDEFRTPVSNSNAAAALTAASEMKGILHLGGKQRLSRLDMGSRAALILGREQKNIKACLRKDIKMPAARPADVSLDSSKAEQAGIKLMGYDEAVLKLFE